MDLVKLAVRQPVTITVGVILIVLAGLLSLGRLPIELTPNVEQTVVQVRTLWEGASPQEIEQEIVDKQEERLQGISGLKGITSTSQQGQGQIRLEFGVGTPREVALREVSDKLREVPEYPENADEPFIVASDPETNDYMAWIAFRCSDPSIDVRIFGDFVRDRVQPLLDRVPGVAEVNVLGGREREVQVRYDPVRLAARGVTPTRLADALRVRNRNVSAGEVAEGKLDVRVRATGQYESLESIERTVIKHDGGASVFVSDVAEVVETYKEPTTFVRSIGEPVIIMNADREVGTNLIRVMAALKEQIADLNRPGGLLESAARQFGVDGTFQLEQVYDQTVYIRDALDLVQDNIWLGGGLAVLVLLLFLRSIRSVGIIGLAIPVSIVGAVVVMVMMGRSVNVISLAGMAFAVGMVVDNSIVVLENVYRHLEMGKTPMQAAYDGAREVWLAVLASTLTTIVVFVPILLIEEEAGQLFRDISLAICATVAISMLVAVTVIPAASSRWLRALRRTGDEAPRRPSMLVRVLTSPLRAIGRIPDLMAGLIYRLNGGVVFRVLIVVGLTAAALFGSYSLMPPADYLPTGNRNLVFGMVIPPPGYNLDQQSRIGSRIEETVRPYFEAGRHRDDPDRTKELVDALEPVPTFDFMRGAPGDPVVPPALENYFLVSFEGIVFHGGVAVDPRRAIDMAPLFQHATRGDRVPGVLAFAFQAPLFQLGGQTGSAVKIDLAGSDLAEVSAAAGAVYGELVGRYGPMQVQPEPANFNLPGPEVRVVPDDVRLAEAGITPADLSLAVQASGDGAIIGEYRLGGETIDLTLRSLGPAREVAALGEVPVATGGGRPVPLSSVASIRRVTSPPQINRVGRQRAVTLQFTPPAGLALERAIDDIDSLLDTMRADGRIPPSVSASFAGSASKLDAVQQALLGDGTFAGIAASSLVVALLVVYLLMCVLFQSFVYPLVILFSVPLATLGGFAALMGVFIWSMTDRYMPVQMLDVLTMLGFIILIGVVVNNAILIVHQSLNNLRGGDGAEPMAPRRAIAEAVRTRVRPIFMSMLTSVGGMLPLVLMPGSGSELYRGLGSVVLGGLLVSTVFTLVLVPLLLGLAMDARVWVSGRAATGADVEPSTASA